MLKPNECYRIYNAQGINVFCIVEDNGKYLLVNIARTIIQEIDQKNWFQWSMHGFLDEMGTCVNGKSIDGRLGVSTGDGHFLPILPKGTWKALGESEIIAEGDLCWQIEMTKDNTHPVQLTPKGWYPVVKEQIGSEAKPYYCVIRRV